MREPLTLGDAAHRANLNQSLFEVILDSAANEKVSKVLLDLISIAMDANFEISCCLDKETGQHD